MGLFGEYPLRTIGVTGPVGGGKTIFGLSVAADCLDKSRPARTLCIDDEGSSEPYINLFNFDRWSLSDIVAEHLKAGVSQDKIWPKLIARISEIPENKYDVLLIDTLDTWESLVHDHVERNPGEFGKTADQWTKMAGVMQATVKAEIKRVIEQVLKQRFEVVVWTAHHRKVWEGNRPTNRTRPQGKDTWMAEASLYIDISRPIDGKTCQPTKLPIGRVLKTRTICKLPDGTLGDPLPPRIDPCTPDKIREYVASPVDHKKLKEREKLDVTIEDGEIVRALSDDDRSMLELQKAEAQRDANRSAMELLATRDTLLRRSEAVRAAAAEAESQAQPAPSHPASKPATPAPTPATAPAVTPKPAASALPKASAEQAGRLIELKQLVGMPEAAWRDNLLKTYKVDNVSALSPEQADDAIAKMEAYARKKGKLGK